MRTAILALALVAQASAFVAPLATGCGATLRGAPHAGARGMLTRSPQLSRLSMGEPKLIYFDARGVVEPTRILLAAAGVKYEDKRYTVDMTTKPPSAPEFNAAKESGALAVNMGRAPMLEFDGAQIGQSHAIARFLARQHSMMGSNDIEAAQIDTLYEHVRDIKDAWVKMRVNPSLDEDAKKAATDKYLSTELPEWCKKLEASIEVFKPAAGCAVGNKMSLGDIAIYAWLSCYYPADKADEVAAAYAKCPHVSGIVKAVGSNAGVAAWEKSRPVTFM